MLTYGSGKTESIVVGLITLYVIVAPIASQIGDFSLTEWIESIENSAEQIEPEQESAIEEAFGEGIVLAVSEKFGIDKENIRIKLQGFDHQTMKAEKIKITLSGVGVFSDYKAVKKYVDGLNLGECDVEIEIG